MKMETTSESTWILFIGFTIFILYLCSKTYPVVVGGGKSFSSLAVVGIRKEPLAWTFATLRSLSSSQQWVDWGYLKYSRSNIPFVIPSIERGPAVIVPPQQLKGIYGLHEDFLDVHATQDQTLQSKWTIWDKEVAKFGLHIKVIRHQLTRNLESLTPVIATELELGFKREWGENPQWRDLKVWDSCLRLIAGAANGAFCGTPLCRDVTFLDRVRDHAMGMFGGAIVINATPRPFKSLVGLIIGILCRYLFKRTANICLPFVCERLRHTARLRTDPNYDWLPPSDGLQWIIDECYDSDNHAQLTPERICHRLLLVNDISMHSTSFTVHNVILDLASADPSFGYIEKLREQCEAVLRENGGSWTFDMVQKLTLVDSAIRESMRLTPFASVGLPRTVASPGGISIENSRTPIPFGTVLAVPIQSIHYDDQIYPEPSQFNPFRFARPQSLNNVLDVMDGVEKASSSKMGHGKTKSSATLDDSFLGFGFGKHACPGRFFALNEMKIFIAHMIINYDIQHISERPKLVDLMWLKLPFNDGRVKVRRRVLDATERDIGYLAVPHGHPDRFRSI